MTTGICPLRCEVVSYVIRACPFIRCSASAEWSEAWRRDISVLHSTTMYAPRGVDSDDDDDRPLWSSDPAPPSRPKFSWKALVSRSKKAAKAAEPPPRNEAQQTSDAQKAEPAIKALKKRVRIFIEGENHPDEPQDAAKATSAPQEESTSPASAAASGPKPVLRSATHVITSDRSVELLREVITLTTILMEFYRLTKIQTSDAHHPIDTSSDPVYAHPSESQPNTPAHAHGSLHDPSGTPESLAFPLDPGMANHTSASSDGQPLHGLNAAYYQSFPTESGPQNGLTAMHSPHPFEAGRPKSMGTVSRQGGRDLGAVEQESNVVKYAAASLRSLQAPSTSEASVGQPRIDHDRQLQTLTTSLKGRPGRRYNANAHQSGNGERSVDLIDCIKAIAHCISRAQGISLFVLIACSYRRQVVPSPTEQRKQEGRCAPPDLSFGWTVIVRPR